MLSYVTMEKKIMHRTQIYLQDELYEELKRRSQARGLSISELIRRAVVKDLQGEPADDARAFFERLTPLKSFVDIEPEDFVRGLRNTSRLMRNKQDDTA